MVSSSVKVSVVHQTSFSITSQDGLKKSVLYSKVNLDSSFQRNSSRGKAPMQPSKGVKREDVN